MIKLVAALSAVFVFGCSPSDSDNFREGRADMRNLDGIAFLGAFEGQEFLICDPEDPDTCRIESLDTRCALEITDAARPIYSEFLERNGLASEGFATMRIIGTGAHSTNGVFGHVGANACEIEFHSIKSITFIANPFDPPPPID